VHLFAFIIRAVVTNILEDFCAKICRENQQAKFSHVRLSFLYVRVFIFITAICRNILDAKLQETKEVLQVPLNFI